MKAVILSPNRSKQTWSESQPPVFRPFPLLHTFPSMNPHVAAAHLGAATPQQLRELRLPRRLGLLFHSKSPSKMCQVFRGENMLHTLPLVCPLSLWTRASHHTPINQNGCSYALECLHTGLLRLPGSGWNGIAHRKTVWKPLSTMQSWGGFEISFQK